MKVSMSVTMDGLIRAMRWKDHGLLEDAPRREATIATGRPQPETLPAIGDLTSPTREDDDASRGS